VEKKALWFPKRSGLKYDKIKTYDPRLYGKQCKLCLKPRPANAGPDYVPKEPKYPAGRPKKTPLERLRKKQAIRRAKALTMQQLRVVTRIKSMLYLSSKGCEECRERDPRKLEYDHIDPSEKKRGVSRYITDGYSWSSDILRAEIRKCRILCANCHRVHTIKQQGYYASDAVKTALDKLSKKYGFKP
jgi:hypothetical protein